jgi:hypothetical protein
MAHAKVDEEAVYKCVGRPQPALVKQILDILLSDSVESAYDSEPLPSSFPVSME